MRTLLKKFVLAAARLSLRLRYRIRVSGLESVRNLQGATLVLPNHPAYIDPVMVLTELKLPIGIPRPVVYTETYRMPPLYPLMRVVNAAEVPDLRRHPRQAAKATRDLIDWISRDLKSGQSFLIYPSGRLQRKDTEWIGGARMTHDLLAQCGNVNLVLVRTRGVWGSVFSCAPTGDVPDLKKVFWLGIPRLLGSLILFLPRRDVSIHVESFDSTHCLGMSRLEFNEWLENWYNHDGGESPIYVPYHRLRRRTSNRERLTRRQSGRGRRLWRKKEKAWDKAGDSMNLRAQKADGND